MKNKSTLLIIVLLIFIIGAIIWGQRLPKNEPSQTEDIATTIPPESESLCYYRSEKTTRGYYDESSLRVDIKNDEITGDFRNLPAEKDSKIGSFDGKIDSVSGDTRTATVWWNSQAEGMQNKEELVLRFSNNQAQAGFGEMVDKGDGTYVYKDKSKITYGPTMNTINCNDLDEVNIVKKYIRENIGSIATGKTVVGGSWYVVSLAIEPTNNTGSVKYEDGHIQSESNFSYTFNKDTNQVVVTLR
jgi:hypothetical protein